MVQLAPNLHHQFLEIPAAERFAAVSKMGFDAVEWRFPYELSKKELKARGDDAGLSFAYAVVPSDWAAGDYGLAGVLIEDGDAQFDRATQKRLADLPIGVTPEVTRLTYETHCAVADTVPREIPAEGERPRAVVHHVSPKDQR